MKANLMLVIVSALAGLLVWSATSAWGTRRMAPAMNSNGMMSGMMQSMSGMHSMMGRGMMNSPEQMKMMGEHMAQGQAMMQEHMQASLSEEKH